MHALKSAAVAALLVLAFPTGVHAQDPVANGLVAYYPFNGSANDESGKGNHGAIIGYDWKFSFDRFGGANSLYLNTTSNPTSTFDGTYVVVPRSASLDFTADFTLSVWVNLPSGLIYHVHNLISNGRDDSGANLRIVSHAATDGRDYFQYIHSRRRQHSKAFRKMRCRDPRSGPVDVT
ncbi:MAG: hypothetical protein AB7O66_13475 [Limisphaerales bacterium]